MFGEFVRTDDSRRDGDGADAIFFRCADVVGMIANQRDGTSVRYPTLFASLAHGDAHESGARSGHFGESSVAEVGAESGSLHFFPADAREVSGDQTRRHASAPEAIEQHARAGADFFSKVGTAARVERLRVMHHLRHGSGDERARGSGVSEHLGEDVAVEHALERNIFGGRDESGDAMRGVDQHLAMMRTRAAQQRAVDIEKNESVFQGICFHDSGW